MTRGYKTTNVPPLVTFAFGKHYCIYDAMRIRRTRIFRNDCR
jgi:hypothetical protein